jgi:hypothetical protein
MKMQTIFYIIKSDSKTNKIIAYNLLFIIIEVVLSLKQARSKVSVRFMNFDISGPNCDFFGVC